SGGRPAFHAARPEAAILSPGCSRATVRVSILPPVSPFPEGAPHAGTSDGRQGLRARLCVAIVWLWSYQTRQAFSRTIGSPGLQLKASANSGMFETTPFTL